MFVNGDPNSTAGANVAAATGGNAAANNHMLHTQDQELAKKIAKESGKYTVEQVEEQLRLMGNLTTKQEPNSIEVLTTTDQIARNIEQDPGMPKAVSGNVIVEVPGKQNAELQQYILKQTADGAGFIPGQTPYVASTPTDEDKRLARTSYGSDTTPPTATCANMDAMCKAGIGQQQKLPLPDGSYGVGLYTPMLGGEFEIELKDGELAGGKAGLGFGGGGHVNFGTRSVEPARLLGPVGGYKSEPSIETNPANSATIRIGPSVTVGGGVGTVGVEAGYAAGIEVGDKTVSGFTNRTAGNIVVSPVIPKVQAEVKVNVIEISIKSAMDSKK